MPPTLHLVANNVSGYCLLDRTCLPCSGLSGKAFNVNFSLSHRSKPGTLAFPPKGLSFVCRASPNGKRRAKKKQNEEGDEYDNNEEPELDSLKSEPILSISNNPSVQTTATPGPKEKEIADLFRKVQLQLKERAARRKEGKVIEVEEAPQPKEESKSKDSISSLLELLRKHSLESDNNGGSITGKAQNGAVSNGIASDLFNDRKNWDKPPSKGISKFTRKSPIPRENHDKPMWSSSEMKKRFLEDTEEEPEMESDDEFSSVKSGGALKKKNLPEVGEYPELDMDFDSESDSETEFDPELEPEPEVEEAEAEAVFSEEEADDEASEDGNEEEEVDLNNMKVVELRELAKARGFTKYSKLKKVELIDLLSRSSG